MVRLRPRADRTAVLGFGLAIALCASAVPVARAQHATPVGPAPSRLVATVVLPDIPLASLQNQALPKHPIGTDRGMVLGSIGSDLWHSAGDPSNEFWMVTDRGPTGHTEVEGENRLTFPVPDFTPLIVHVRAENSTLQILEAIPIVNQAGAPVTGLPNLDGVDEQPYDVAAATALAYNQDGLDTEGLVRTADGTFWLAEEYRPSLVKVDAAGTVLARYVPEGVTLPDAGYPVEATLPAIYASRTINRGFEGLALSGDGQTLYAVLQSPLRNPDQKTGEASRASRILAVDVDSGKPVAEYVYWLEPAAAFDPALGAGDESEMKLSGLVWLNETTLLVLERTETVARLYTVDLAAATDLLGSAWDEPATAPSLEALDDPAAAGVRPLPKTLLVDLAALPGMPHAIEGVTVIDDQTIAVANDGDFATGAGVPNEVLMIQTPVRP
jgi:Esterase-like activity of phytase